MISCARSHKLDFAPGAAGEQGLTNSDPDFELWLALVQAALYSGVVQPLDVVEHIGAGLGFGL